METERQTDEASGAAASGSEQKQKRSSAHKEISRKTSHKPDVASLKRFSFSTWCRVLRVNQSNLLRSKTIISATVHNTF